MESYFGVAKDLGISRKEIGAAQSIVMAVSAGQIRAKFREVRRDAAKKSRQVPSDGR